MSDWRDSNIVEAVKLFPNAGLHGAAKFIAQLDEKAIDYLRQAPVLSLSFGVKSSTAADRLYVAMRVGGPISRGERLRSVMSAIGLAYPLRKFHANALDPQARGIVRILGQMSHSELSQCIPESAGAQRTWLRAIAAFTRRSELRGRVPLKEEVHWVAQKSAPAVGQHTRRQMEEVADYLLINGAPQWDRWSWAKMMAEVDLWHDQLAVEKQLPHGIQPDTVVDLSDWPDHFEAGGLEFFKLSTPAMLITEGSRMRHCVASYLPDVINGTTSIFSVRDRMRRVATVQLVRGQPAQISGFANAAIPSSRKKTIATGFKRIQGNNP